MYYRDSQQVYAGLGGWGAVVSTFKDGVDYLRSGEQAKGAVAAQQDIIEALAKQNQQKQQTPSWVLPVAIGGGVLVLALVMTGGRREGS